jgi:hypothetical protein
MIRTVVLTELSDRALIVSAIAVMTSVFFIRSNSSKMTISDAAVDSPCRARRTLSGVIASSPRVVGRTGCRAESPTWGCRRVASISFSAFIHNDEKLSDMSQFVRDITKAVRFARNAEIMLDNEVLPTPRSP